MRRGSAAPPVLKIFRANSVFRASASCSKILKDKKICIQYSEFRANSVFRASARRSKILNDKKYFNKVKNFRATRVFQGKRKLLRNPEW